MCGIIGHLLPSTDPDGAFLITELTAPVQTLSIHSGMTILLGGLSASKMNNLYLFW